MRSGGLVFGLLLAARLCLGCELVDSGPKHWVFACNGASRWRLHELFSSRAVYTSCPSKLVVDNVNLSDSTIPAGICVIGGLHGFLSESGHRMGCLAEISPFQSGNIRIRSASRIGGVGHCEVQAKINKFSRPRLAICGIGLLLILVAKGLASSSHFRIGVGTIFVMLLGLFILGGTLILRPGKIKTMVVICLGSMFALLTQFISSNANGQAFSIWNMNWSYVLGAYVAVSGIVGWMVCYYYDNAQDTRRISLVVHCIRLVGVAMILLSCSDVVVGIILGISIFCIQFILAKLGPRKGLSMVASTGSIFFSMLRGLESWLSARQKVRQGKLGVGCIHVDHSRRGSGGLSMSEDEYSDWEGEDTPKAMQKWCDMCKRGYIVNRTSNRTIHIGGPTYLRLMDEGRIPNLREGFI